VIAPQHAGTRCANAIIDALAQDELLHILAQANLTTASNAVAAVIDNIIPAYRGGTFINLGPQAGWWALRKAVQIAHFALMISIRASGP
jgi:hypothetical protein